MTWLRAIAAAGLSVLFPGAGHALLRDWVRAVLFAGLYLTTVVLFFPTERIADAGSISEGMDVAATEVTTMTQLTILFVTLIAALDATFRALGFPPEADGAGDDGPSCPECGRELDADLEFCHWCTARLEPESAEEEPAQP